MMVFKVSVLKFSKFHRKALLLEFLFDKVAGQHRCFPMKIATLLRTYYNKDALLLMYYHGILARVENLKYKILEKEFNDSS